MEYTKFDHRRGPYSEALSAFQELDFSVDDFIHHNPSFAGHMNIARFLALYEIYRKTLGLSGHIAEVGVWKASCLLFFAKLTLLFEPESFTLVHGFDWYRGLLPGADESTDVVRGLWQRSARSELENRARSPQEGEQMYRKIRRLIEVQQLDNTVYLHKLDVTRELRAFFQEHPHLQFKIVFLDAGTYEVTKACLPYFWPRLVGNGILILDQYNNEIAPGETRAVREYFDDVTIRSFVFTGHPSAYVVKPCTTNGTQPGHGIESQERVLEPVHAGSEF
jgi:hypothetical protein